MKGSLASRVLFLILQIFCDVFNERIFWYYPCMERFFLFLMMDDSSFYVLGKSHEGMEYLAITGSYVEFTMLSSILYYISQVSYSMITYIGMNCFLFMILFLFLYGSYKAFNPNR